MDHTKNIQKTAIRIIELIAEEKKINKRLVEIKTELSFLADSCEKTNYRKSVKKDKGSVKLRKTKC